MPPSLFKEAYLIRIFLQCQHIPYIPDFLSFFFLRACSLEVLLEVTHETGNFETSQLNVQLPGKIPFILTDEEVMFQQTGSNSWAAELSSLSTFSTASLKLTSVLGYQNK